MGTGSVRGPSSRRWTCIPCTSMNVEGGCAQRACRSDSGRSGAQVAATNTAMTSTSADRTPLRITAAFFMGRSKACLFVVPGLVRERQTGEIGGREPAVGFDVERVEDQHQLPRVLGRVPGSSL